MTKIFYLRWNLAPLSHPSICLIILFKVNNEDYAFLSPHLPSYVQYL